MRMTKIDYANTIANMVNGEVKEITKTNGIVQTGIQVPTDEIVAPVVYIDDAYENGTPVEEVVGYINSISERSKGMELNIDVMDYNMVKSNICLRLLNASNAENCEVYESAAQYGFDDLIIVPYVSNIIEDGYTRVVPSMLEAWGKTTEEVIEKGFENTYEKVTKLEEILAELTGASPEEMEIMGMTSPFYCVRDRYNTQFGAVAVIKAREQLDEMFTSGYYVIPSSVHEVLILPADFPESEEVLNGIVNDVNTEVLAQTDYLSDYVYKFGVA